MEKCPSRRAPRPMKERSESCLVHRSIDVNIWVRSPPGVDEARPAKCPHCGEAGRPSGEPLGMVGHGMRRRQIRGPTRPGVAPSIEVILARRYRCRGCRRTATVVPKGVVAGRHYSATAIALACFLVGLCKLGLEEVRRRVAPGSTYEAGWPVVRRWLRAIHAGRLLPFVRPWPTDRAALDLRRGAERVATTVMALAPGPHANDEERLFAGIALAA